eukprot:scaffold2.g7384.t1
MQGSRQARRLPGRVRGSATACSVSAASVAAPAAAPASSGSPARSDAAESGRLGGIHGLPNVVQVLRERGLMQDATAGAELEAAAASASLSVYCGFDPTAESLHLGNLLGIVVLSWFQRCGHRPVALIGGATAAVGDPSGKSAERPVLSPEAIAKNTAGIAAMLSALLSVPDQSSSGDGGAPPPHPPLLLNNLDWLGGMGLLTFLRDVGKFARVGSMVAKESVRRRMESEAGISYTEFTYQLLQGYDFVHLCRHHGVRVQIGGSDQWGNIVAGTDLIRRMLGGGEQQLQQAAAGGGGDGAGGGETQCFGLTFPLLLKSDGTKFGKSEIGAVWLNAELLSPYQFYQFLFRTADADVCRLLRMLTFLPLEEALAPGAETELDVATLEAIAGDAPSATLPRAAVVGAPLADVMVAAGMQPSKAAVRWRRMIKGGGVRLNNARVDDEGAVVGEGDLVGGRLALLAAGKKNKLLLRVAEGLLRIREREAQEALQRHAWDLTRQRRPVTDRNGSCALVLPSKLTLKEGVEIGGGLKLGKMLGAGVQARVFELVDLEGRATDRVIKINHKDFGHKLLNNSVVWIGMEREWQIGQLLWVALQEPDGTVPGFMKVLDCLARTGKDAKKASFNGMVMERINGWEVWRRIDTPEFCNIHYIRELLFQAGHHTHEERPPRCGRLAATVPYPRLWADVQGEAKSRAASDAAAKANGCTACGVAGEGGGDATPSGSGSLDARGSSAGGQLPPPSPRGSFLESRATARCGLPEPRAGFSCNADGSRMPLGPHIEFKIMWRTPAAASSLMPPGGTNADWPASTCQCSRTIACVKLHARFADEVGSARGGRRVFGRLYCTGPPRVKEGPGGGSSGASAAEEDDDLGLVSSWLRKSRRMHIRLKAHLYPYNSGLLAGEALVAPFFGVGRAPHAALPVCVEAAFPRAGF